MISRIKLSILEKYNLLPVEFQIPMCNTILNLIYSNDKFTKCQSIEELDLIQNNSKSDISYYKSMRPIIKCLFDLENDTWIDQILNTYITDDQINNNQIINSQMTDDQINDNQINDDQINDDQIINSQMTNDQINDDQINDDQINNNQIINSQMTDDQINDNQINDDQINDDQINDNQINDDQIINSQMTDDQINDNQINDNQIINNQMTDDQINDDQINNNQIINSQMTDDQINDDQINDDQINDDQINDDQINDDQINDDQINDDQIMDIHITNIIKSTKSKIIQTKLTKSKSNNYPNAIIDESNDSNEFNEFNEFNKFNEFNESDSSDMLNLSIPILANEDYDDESNDNFKLNTSQKQVVERYKKQDINSGIICHATGTGKTISIFLTITEFERLNPNLTNNTIFIFCNYKNIINQMFYKSNENGTTTINYDLFRMLKKHNVFDLWSYNIYNLTDKSIRNHIMKNINQIKIMNKKKIFLINPQFVISNEKQTYMNLPTPNLILHDECHSITGNFVFKFLMYFKNLNAKIIGTSATPIRNIRSSHNYHLLKTIYSSDGENLNLISSYEYITAIINGDILNFEVFWFEALLNSNAQTNRLNETNIQNLIECIHKVCLTAPNKKVLLWCGTTDHANNVYDKICKNAQMLEIFGINIFIDHSKIDTDNLISESYNKFKSLKSNCIMICADKYREGSDFEYLDIIVFGDLVKSKGELSFIQCIGRVLRKGFNKTVGYVIDHYDASTDYKTKTRDIINKLIGYYYEFFNYTSDTTNKTDKSNIDKFNYAIEMYEDILYRYRFEKSDDSNIIMIKLTDNLSIKINTGLNNENFANVDQQFKPAIIQHIQKEFNLQADELLRLEYMKFKKNNNEFLQIETKDEYYNKMNDLNLEPTPEIKYALFWTNWHDYLAIDTSLFPESVDKLKEIILDYNIRSWNEYLKMAKNLNLPIMLTEFYGSTYSNFNELIDYNMDVNRKTKSTKNNKNTKKR